MKLLYAVAFFFLTVSLRAEVNILYQPYTLDELVIDTDGYKITAKELGKYGMEPVHVVITNTGDTEEIIHCDKKRLSVDQVYKQFRYSILIAVGKGFGIFIACNLPKMISVLSRYRERGYVENDLQELSLAIIEKDYRAWSLLQWDSLDRLAEISAEINKERNLYFEEYGLIGKGVKKFLEIMYICLELYPPYRSYMCNDALYASLSCALMPDTLVISPGATVTKLMLIQKEIDPK